MSKTPFMIGQRWVSEAESELGLGIVLELSERQLTLSFPASGERRTYAIKGAPVSRVRYQVGERVSSQEGATITIDEVLEQNGCLAYQGHTDSGEAELIPEFELDSFVQFTTPRERLFAGQIDKHKDFTLRYQSLDSYFKHRQSPGFGLTGARVDLLPHQMTIARQVSRRHAPRVLLADEVGLGKTIEAGLILHQQLQSGQIQRALVVVPQSLQHQWLVEMLRRFNLSFTLLDEERCQNLWSLDDIDPSLLPDDEEIVIDEADDNPFESAQLVICALDFLVANPKRHQQALDAGWDMLLVDEAHHLQWSPDAPSPAYQCVEALARNIPACLLLTATPEQLGLESHFARLRLLDPDRYHDLQTFIDEESSYFALNRELDSLLAARADTPGAFTSEHWQLLSSYLPASTCEHLQALAKSESLAAATDKAVAYLLDQHGTGRVLFRNTRNSVAGFPERQLVPHPLVLDDEALMALEEQPLESQLRPETFWETHTGDDWLLADPRVEWLTELLKANRRQKTLVICASADTALALELHLRLRKGLPTSVFHEGMSLFERDRAAAYFADHVDGAQVLICSEIGSEGRNFQFAQDLVLLDLPLNPDLLEQRIGRLDRIGQKGDIRLHVPYYEDSVQENLLNWYHQGINAFEKTCAIGQAVKLHVGEAFTRVLSDGDESEVADLIENTRRYAAELSESLQSGRDRLLEMNSCQPALAQSLIEELTRIDSESGVDDYLDRVCDAFGVEVEDHGERSLVLHPGNHMRVSHVPGLLDDGMTVTTSRVQALARDDMHFLTWEHPLIRGAQELIIGGEFGNTAVCTLKLPPLKPGTLMVEAVFVLKCTAPTELQLPKYLGDSLVRVLLDDKGKDLAGVLEIGKLSQLLQKVSRPQAQELVRHARPVLTEIINQAEQKVRPQQEALVSAAVAQMHGELTDEAERLKALAAVNPNIHPDEIHYWEERREQSRGFLESATLQLDSVRVIMTV